ncbi:MAG TPA: hypothetical protein VFF32_08345 [Dermatophilaceae bacterium]|nr:hypothetical protein [Dermatophilaceae bacterium]
MLELRDEDLVQIWQWATRQPLQTRFREQFLEKCHLHGLGSIDAPTLRVAAQVATDGHTLRIERWHEQAQALLAIHDYDRPYTAQAGSRPTARRNATKATPTQRRRRGKGGAVPERAAKTPGHAGAKYGGMVHPEPVESHLQKIANKARKVERYQ